MSRVLVVKMSSMGDVVHALPAVSEALAQGHQIDWVVEEAFADIPRLLDGIGQVLPIAWRRWRREINRSGDEMRAFWRTLRASTYDVVLDSQGLIKSAMVGALAKTANGGRRHGFSHTVAREPWAAFAYGAHHAVAKEQHAIQRQRQLYAAALGYDIDPERLPTVNLCMTAAPDERRRVLFLHGTTWASKHWPETMWQALARLAVADGYEVVVTGAAEAELERAARLAVDDGVTALPRMPLKQLAQVIAGCEGVVGVDSGLAHLSAVMGRATLGLYGPTDGRLTGPLGPRARCLQSRFACAPCLSSRCTYKGPARSWSGASVEPACFAELDPHRVWQAARELMDTR